MPTDQSVEGSVSIELPSSQATLLCQVDNQPKHTHVWYYRQENEMYVSPFLSCVVLSFPVGFPVTLTFVPSQCERVLVCF